MLHQHRLVRHNNHITAVPCVLSSPQQQQQQHATVMPRRSDWAVQRVLWVAIGFLAIGSIIALATEDVIYAIPCMTVTIIIITLIADLNIDIFLVKRRKLRYLIYVLSLAYAFAMIFAWGIELWPSAYFALVFPFHAHNRLIIDASGTETATGGTMSHQSMLIIFVSLLFGGTSVNWLTADPDNSGYPFRHIIRILGAIFWGSSALIGGIASALLFRYRYSDNVAFFMILYLWVFSTGSLAVFHGVWRNDRSGDFPTRLYYLCLGGIQVGAVTIILVFRRRIVGGMSRFLEHGVRVSIATQLGDRYMGSGFGTSLKQNAGYINQAKLNFRSVISISNRSVISNRYLKDVKLLPADDLVEDGLLAATDRYSKFGLVDFFVVAPEGERFTMRVQKALEHVTAKFLAAKGRPPTFWTLSCCDGPQCDIMVPMFAAGCTRALILFCEDLLKQPRAMLLLHAAISIHLRIEIMTIGGYTYINSKQLLADVKSFDVSDLADYRNQESDRGIISGTADDIVAGILQILVENDELMSTVKQLEPSLLSVSNQYRREGTTEDRSFRIKYSLEVPELVDFLILSRPAPAELSVALLDVIESGFDDLALKLLQSGASAAIRSRDSHLLPHTIVLSRESPSIMLLEALFRGHCEIDSSLGTAILNHSKLEIMSHALANLGIHSWRDAEGRTVLHCIVDGCRQGHISDDVASKLCQRVLAANPRLLSATDCRGQTAGDCAMRCEDAVQLERLLTVVVFGLYQLIHPNDQLYASPTALVLECCDLQDENTKLEGLVIKLMTDEFSWIREIESRASIQSLEKFVIPLHAATTTRPRSRYSADDLKDAVNIQRFYGQARHSVATDLMLKYPYALVMERGDRNLFEIISNERLSTEPLSVIRLTALKIARGLEALHQIHVVHGDVKPRNIVRSNEGAFKLIDFDMAFRVDKNLAALSIKYSDYHAIADKLVSTSAYVSPELVSWSDSIIASQPQERPDSPPPIPITTAKHGFKVDIWSYGVLLFELATGTPLLKNTYDRAIGSSLTRLRGWTGLEISETDEIINCHGQEAAALVDLLGWILDPDVRARPDSMKAVIGHAFLNPANGTMREQFVVQYLKQRLSADLGGYRPCRSVMISYCWHDSSWVLNQLAMWLAPLVEAMYLDRLGGEQGMGEWAKASMQRMVGSADIVIAVLSPAYVKSINCGYEMSLAGNLGKDIIPLVLDLPYTAWPPHTIGNTKMQHQFWDSRTGDNKLYIDFSKQSLFETKFRHELIPRITKPHAPHAFEDTLSKIQNDIKVTQWLPTTLTIEFTSADIRHKSILMPKELRRAALSVEKSIAQGRFSNISLATYQQPNSAQQQVIVRQPRSVQHDGTSEYLTEAERHAFLMNALIMTQFRHPNILGLLGVVTAGPPLMMIFEYCPEGTLHKALRSNNLFMENLVWYAIEIARGMAFLHGLRFLHRELCARNVLIGPKGTAKITNFGLCMEIASQASTVPVPGNYSYLPWLAPECFAPVPKFTEASDLWSFGVTMIEIFSGGARPYGDIDDDEIIKTVQNGMRLASPKSCPAEIYQSAICTCFNSLDCRSSFAVLVAQLEKMVVDLDYVRGELVKNGTSPKFRRKDDHSRHRMLGSMGFKPEYFKQRSPFESIHTKESAATEPIEATEEPPIQSLEESTESNIGKHGYPYMSTNLQQMKLTVSDDNCANLEIKPNLIGGVNSQQLDDSQLGGINPDNIVDVISRKPLEDYSNVTYL